MKVLKTKIEESKAFVITLSTSLCDRLDAIAERESKDGQKVFRSDVIRATLEAALGDKEFTVTIKK